MINQVERLKKLIARANDSASSPAEIATALNHAAKIVIKIPSLRTTEADEEIAELEAERDRLRRWNSKAVETMQRLENEAALLKRRSERAEEALKVANKSIEALTKRFGQAQPKQDRPDLGSTPGIASTDGISQVSLGSTVSDAGADYIPFETYAVRARTKIGRAAWRAAVAYHLNISLKLMSAWKMVGLVPAAFLARLEEMTDVERQSASRDRWTAAEHHALKGLLNEGKGNLEVARMLSAKFDRRLYESSIVSQRRRLRQDDGWAPARRFQQRRKHYVS